MSQYVGLDISMEETSVCVLDGAGNVTFEGACTTDPGAIALIIQRHANGAERIVFETGSLSNWLWHELKARGLPAICLDARHANAALSMRMNKSDKNDAKGLAEMARMGWYREVSVKTIENRKLRSLLAARAKLVELRRDLDNQMRGLCKGMGIVLGRCGSQGLAKKVAAVVADVPELQGIFQPLLSVQACLSKQIETFDTQLSHTAKIDCTAHRLMTVPGVGPLTALSFIATIDDPKRFKSSANVGAYLGLTPRRYQSGEIDRTGRISKRGDHLLRTYLYEAAAVLLTVVRKGSTLKRWGTKLAKRIGSKKAKVAVARKLSAILHAIWIDGTEFQPEGQTA